MDLVPPVNNAELWLVLNLFNDCGSWFLYFNLLITIFKRLYVAIISSQKNTYGEDVNLRSPCACQFVYLMIYIRDVKEAKLVITIDITVFRAD